MGTANVLATYTLWRDLPHRAHRLLTYMAARSLDDTNADGRPPRRSFLSPDEMADAIGVTDHRIVRRTLAELVTAGAATRVVDGRRGHRAEYALNLDPLRRAETTRSRRVETTRSGGSPQPSTAGRFDPPQEYRGTTEDNEKEPESSSPPVPHQGPADATHADDDDNEYAAALRTLEPLPTGRYLELKRQARNTLGPAAFERDIVIAAAAKHEAANR
ncbi:MAG TPA: hypothetical protein VGK32_02630 [Vicinamibacterales bacterium]